MKQYQFIFATLLCSSFLLTNCKEKKKDDAPAPTGNENKVKTPMPMNNITMGGASLGSEYPNRILLGNSYSRGFISSVAGQELQVDTFSFAIDMAGMFLFDGTASGINAGTITVNDSIVPWDESQKCYFNEIDKTPPPPTNYNLMTNAKIKATGGISIAAFEINVSNPLSGKISIIAPEIVYEKSKGIKLTFSQPVMGADSINAAITTTNSASKEKMIIKAVALGATSISFTPAELGTLYADSSANLSISAFKNSFPTNIANRKTHVLGLRSNNYLIILK